MTVTSGCVFKVELEHCWQRVHTDLPPNKDNSNAELIAQTFSPEENEHKTGRALHLKPCKVFLLLMVPSYHRKKEFFCLQKREVSGNSSYLNFVLPS